MAHYSILCENYYYFDGETFQSGGGESYLFNLVQSIKKAGDTVSVYQFSWDKFTKKYSNPQGNVKVIGLGNVDKFKPNYQEDLKKGVDMFVSATKDSDAYILLTMNLAYKKLPKPTIGIFHGIYWNFVSDAYRQPEWNDLVKSWVRNVDLIVSVDTDCVNFIRANMPKYISKLHYIANYVDVDLFKPKPRTPDKFFRVLYARRLNDLRGINIAINSAKTLTQKYDDIQFTFCGRGLNGAEDIVNNWCKTQRNCDHMSKDLSGMQDVYPNYDISIVPSIASEGLSLSLLESMGCGVPVIGTDVGGIPNALINNYNGLMIRANQEIELTNAIEYSYLNRDIVSEWGKNAYGVAQTFNKERWTDHWLKMLKCVNS